MTTSGFYINCNMPHISVFGQPFILLQLVNLSDYLIFKNYFFIYKNTCLNLLTILPLNYTIYNNYSLSKNTQGKITPSTASLSIPSECASRMILMSKQKAGKTSQYKPTKLSSLWHFNESLEGSFKIRNSRYEIRNTWFEIQNPRYYI